MKKLAGFQQKNISNSAWINNLRSFSVSFFS